MLLRLFYAFLENGQKCVVCDSKTFLFPICKKCRIKHFNVEKRLDIPRCEVCGRELTSNHNKCSLCKESPVLMNTDSVVPLFSYRLWNKELLFNWKIKGERNCSVMFAGFMNQALKHMNIQYVIPVPPRKGKIRKNGWDQIDELCTFLELKYNYKILRILERKSVKQQKKLNREERLETIKNAYGLINGKIFEKEMKKCENNLDDPVALIDDVCTTGSTLECCAKILKDFGFSTVKAVTLFTVD